MFVFMVILLAYCIDDAYLCRRNKVKGNHECVFCYMIYNI